eukprot:scaffold15108_cov180-Amphora_coffeaeformis.AAC.89
MPLTFSKAYHWQLQQDIRLHHEYQKFFSPLSVMYPGSRVGKDDDYDYNNKRTSSDEDEVAVVAVKAPAKKADKSSNQAAGNEDLFIPKGVAAAAVTTSLATSPLNDIPDGETISVPGKQYKMKNVGGVYSSTCHGWKFQKAEIDVRTCKHLKAYRDELVEIQRITGKKNCDSVNNHDSTSGGNGKKKAAAADTKGLFGAKQCMLAHKWGQDSTVQRLIDI